MKLVSDVPWKNNFPITLEHAAPPPIFESPEKTTEPIKAASSVPWPRATPLSFQPDCHCHAAAAMSSPVRAAASAASSKQCQARNDPTCSCTALSCPHWCKRLVKPIPLTSCWRLPERRAHFLPRSCRPATGREQKAWSREPGPRRPGLRAGLPSGDRHPWARNPRARTPGALRALGLGSCPVLFGTASLTPASPLLILFNF